MQLIVSHFYSCSSRGCSGPKTKPDPRSHRLPAARVGSRRPNHQGVALIQHLLILQTEHWIWCHGDWGNRNYSNDHMLRTGSRKDKNENPEVQAPHREVCLYKGPGYWIFPGDFQVSFQALGVVVDPGDQQVGCFWSPTHSVFYLALLSQSPGVQILPAWCSSRRNCCCPWSWFAASPAGKPHHQSYLYRMQLEPGKKETKTEKPQWP